jgi:hypothetical protein
MGSERNVEKKEKDSEIEKTKKEDFTEEKATNEEEKALRLVLLVDLKT